MATLTELTAVTVADACRPYGLTEVVASGGGVRNPALLAALRRRLAPTPLVTTDERGLPADAKEAYLVALLGFLTWHQLPGVVPGGTGSAVPRVLGRLSPGDAPLHLPAPVPPPQPARRHAAIGGHVRQLDLVVVVVYLVAIGAVGLWLSGRQKSAKDYFVGEGSMPWWAVCFSVVATETSVLTVISVPGGAYTNQAFGNVELALGYVIGRVVVATVLIPLYRRGGFVSAYQYLAARFGRYLQGLASVTFVFTRLLAEGVRLFASAIPIKLLLDEFGVVTSYGTIIVVLTAITVVYTYLGGIKAVIWTDAIQMGLYLGGAVLAIIVLSASVGGAGFAARRPRASSRCSTPTSRSRTS